MAAAEATPLEAAFEKLAACVKNQQHKKALKACDESECCSGGLKHTAMTIAAHCCAHRRSSIQQHP
mgnify:CR=1 FL=1